MMAWEGVFLMGAWSMHSILIHEYFSIGHLGLIRVCIQQFRVGVAILSITLHSLPFYAQHKFSAYVNLYRLNHRS